VAPVDHEGLNAETIERLEALERQGRFVYLTDAVLLDPASMDPFSATPFLCVILARPPVDGDDEPDVLARGRGATREEAALAALGSLR
jgi:hypothetical protein